MPDELDRALRRAIVTNAERAGYAVTAVSDGLSGIAAIRDRRFDVVLLDIGLPFVDGWRILGSLEGRRAPSVIVVSARGDEQDKVRALDMGADDYLAKPFGADEPLARLRAVLRRVRPPTEPSRVVTAAEVAVDLGARTVTRTGREVALSPTEYLLVAELARHAGQVLDHRTLLQTVWGPGVRERAQRSLDLRPAAAHQARGGSRGAAGHRHRGAAGIPLRPGLRSGGRRLIRAGPRTTAIPTRGR